MPDRPLLTIPQAAAELVVSRHTVYRLITDGTLEAVQVRSRLRIRPRDLERYLDRLADTARKGEALGGAGATNPQALVHATAQRDAACGGGAEVVSPRSSCRISVMPSSRNQMVVPGTASMYTTHNTELPVPSLAANGADRASSSRVAGMTPR